MAWVVAGFAAALLVVAGLRGTDGEPSPRATPDPLKQVVASGRVLEDPRGRSADVSRPPVGGPPSRPLADGVYTEPQRRDRLIGPLRRGVVVIQYDRRLPAEKVDLLRRAFAPTSPRRELAPDGTGITFTLAATAWGRVIGCSKLDARVVEGQRTFARRYAGRGPDA